MKAALFIAKQLGFSRILLECGIKLAKSFLNRKLVNDLKIFISNKKIGKSGDYNFKDDLKYFINNKKMRDEKINLSGDKFLSYKIK